MASMKGRLVSGVSNYFNYKTTKVVTIRDKRIGIVKKLLQLGVFVGYVIIYNLIIKKGYQEVDSVVSLGLTKLKGVTYTQMQKVYQDITNRTWDVADLVIPPEESDAIFITTNVIITPKQTKGKCDEDPGIPDAICKKDTDCKALTPVINGNGVKTGRCIQSKRNSTVKVCEIHAWCPVEVNQVPKKPILSGTKDFTVLIKNWIAFPKFNQNWKNIIDDVDNKKYLKTCRYDPKHKWNKYCPVFKLGTIVQLANQSYDEIALLGGVIAVDIDWNCNLDKSIKACRPKYKFYRLDDKETKFAKGWNFRYADFYRQNNILHRDLIKVYGIRLIIKVTGRAGKFGIIPFFLVFGSGAGLVALATAMWNSVVMCLCSDYKKQTHQYVEKGDKDESSDEEVEMQTPSSKMKTSV